MTIVEPLTIADANYTGGNLVESDTVDAPEWVDGTDYVRENRVRIAATHSIYQCLVDHTADDGVNDPTTEAAAFADPLTMDPDPAHWVYVSQTNKWRLFDGRPSQRSENAGAIEAVVTPPGRVNSVALINMLDASEVTIEIFDDDGMQTFTRTVSLIDTTTVLDWFDYFFAPNVLLDSYVAIDLPITFITDELHVTIAGGDDLACGQIVMGYGQLFGITTSDDTGFEGLDFSHVETNPYGDLVTVQRAATDIYRFDVLLRTQAVNAFATALRKLRGGRRALWVGTAVQGIRAWQYGFARDYQTYYIDGANTRSRLTVQGVV